MILRRKNKNNKANRATNETATAVTSTKTLGRFQADRSGSTAVEFSLLAIPFFALMFAIIESSLSFTAQQILANVTDDIARDIRTGRFKQGDVRQGTVADRICDRLDVLVSDGCPELEIDLRPYARFADVPTTIPLRNNDINTTGFIVQSGPSLSINSIRVFYRWPIIADMVRSKLSNLKDGKTLLFATATWRNEPFQD